MPTLGSLEENFGLLPIHITGGLKKPFFTAVVNPAHITAHLAILQLPNRLTIKTL